MLVKFAMGRTKVVRGEIFVDFASEHVLPIGHHNDRSDQQLRIVAELANRVEGLTQLFAPIADDPLRFVYVRQHVIVAADRQSAQTLDFQLAKELPLTQELSIQNARAPASPPAARVTDRFPELAFDFLYQA